MSDNAPPDSDFGPDPIDKAYVQAESLLGDDSARAARRARVLAAVARELAAPSAPSSISAFPPDRRHGGWRRGGWLAAACVAGLSVFVSAQIYRSAPRQTQTAPTAATTAATPAPPAPAPSKTPGVVAAPPQAAAPASAPPRLVVPLAAPPPPPPSIEPERRPYAAAPVAAPSPPPPAPPSIVVMEEPVARARTAKASRDFSDGAIADTEDLARSGASRPASPVGAAPPVADVQSGQGARLRAAAARGRTAEVEALLEQGTPVDAPDPDGDTALMKSIEADHPSIAAILRRHGASLDRKNNAGESARDMAAARGDMELNRAIGLEP